MATSQAKPKFTQRIVRALAAGSVLATVLTFGLAVPAAAATTIGIGAALSIELSADFAAAASS